MRSLGGFVPTPNPSTDFPSSLGGNTYIGDHIGEMDPAGNQFWLYLSGGGAVHFEGGGADGYYSWHATKVVDSHGLETNLEYNGPGGNLSRVVAPANRALDITWGYVTHPQALSPPALSIVRVQSGTGSGSQAAVYEYSWYSAGQYQWPALTGVSYEYQDVPVPDEQSVYLYTPWNSQQYAARIRGYGPLLREADDSRFEGAMTRILYVFCGGPGIPAEGARPSIAGGEPFCDYPNQQALPGTYSAMSMAPFPVERELSATTGMMVASLWIPCNGTIDQGKRIETKGSGGQRVFYYGPTGGVEPGSRMEEVPNGPDNWYPPEANPGGGARGYNGTIELTKLTDFANDRATAQAGPADFYHNFNWHPWRVFDQRGTLTQYAYEPSFQNPTALDGTSRVKEIWYRGSEDSGAKRTFSYTPSGASDPALLGQLRNPYTQWLFGQTDENGNSTVYHRDGLRRIKQIDYPDGSNEAYGYDDRFNTVTYHRLPSGAEERREYDGRGRLNWEYNSVDGWDARKEYTYDALDRVWTMTDGRARAAGAPFTVRLSYNARHQIATEEYPATATSPAASKQYVYDKYGNCTDIRNELNQWSHYRFDTYRRCTEYEEPLEVQNWNGSAYQPSRKWNWYYDRYHEETGLRDASTHTSKEWRVQVEPAYNAAGDRPLSAQKFDYNGRVIEAQTGLIEAANGAWSAGPDLATVHYSYDANGNKKSYSDERDRPTTYTYDRRDRLKLTNAPLGRVTENWYDWAGNKTQVRFPDGMTNQWQVFDGFGQPRIFIDERNQTTHLDYWPWGSMKKLQRVTTHRTQDGGGTEDQRTTFYPDQIGRPQRSDFPDGTFEVMHYSLGQMDSFQTRKGQVKHIHYDARAREDSSWWDNDAAPRIDRQWDAANRLSLIANNVATIDYNYDAAGQIREEGTTVAGAGGRARVWYARYPSGEPSHFIHPMGWWSRRDYNTRGQLKAVGWDNGAGEWLHQLVNYTYNVDGTVWYGYKGNGAQTGFHYDDAGRLDIAHNHRAQPSYQNFSYRTYYRDSRDRIYAWQKSGDTGGFNNREDGRGERYEYDGEGQLTRAYYQAPDPVNSGNGYWEDDNFGGWDANGNWRGYDQVGNREGNNYQAGRGWVWYNRRENGLNQYLNWSPGATTYDDQWYGTAGNGVLMQEGLLTASYNALNQPIAMFSPNLPGSQFLWFGYDPLGRCVKRSVSANGSPNAPATYLYYDGWNLIQEGPSAGNAEWIYFHGGKVDELAAGANLWTGGWNYYHYDGRGSVVMLSDEWGNVVEQYDYRAFGEPLMFDAAGNYHADTWRGNRFLFTGREWLKDLKIYDYRTRMYQPAMGRFLQPDPKQFEANDYNLYRYCHNDPVNKTDPMGLYVTYTDKWSDQDVQKFNKEFAKQWGTAEGRAAWESRYNSSNEFRVSPDRTTGTREQGASNFNIGEYGRKGVLQSIGQAFRDAANSVLGMAQGNSGFEKGRQGDNTAKNKQAEQAANKEGLSDTQKEMFHDQIHGRDLPFEQLRQEAAAIKQAYPNK